MQKRSQSGSLPVSHRPLKLESLESRLLLAVGDWGGFADFPEKAVYENESAVIEFESDVDRLAIADMNGDGYNDIVSLNCKSSTISVYINDGNGVYGSALSTIIAIPSSKALSSSQVGVTLGDFNSDGKTDLLVAGQVEEGSSQLNFWFYTYDSSSTLYSLAKTSTVSLSVYASGSSYLPLNYEMTQVNSGVALRLSNLYVDGNKTDRTVCFNGDGAGSFTAPSSFVYKKTNPLTPLYGESLVGSVTLTNGKTSRTFLVTQSDTFNFYDMSASPVSYSSVIYATEKISAPLGTTISGDVLYYCNTNSLGEILLQMDASGKVTAAERGAFDLTGFPTTGVVSMVIGAGALNSGAYTDLMVTIGTEYAVLKGIPSETNLPNFDVQPPVITQPNYLATWVGDYNGDGTTDLLVAGSAGIWLYSGADITVTPTMLGYFNGEATAAVFGYFGSSASSSENDSYLDVALLYDGRVGIFFQQDGRFTGKTVSEGSCVVTYSSVTSGEESFLVSGDVLGTGNEQLVVAYYDPQEMKNTIAVIDPLNWGSGPVETMAIPNNYRISSIAVGALCGEIVSAKAVIDSYADIVYSVQSRENSSLTDLKSKIVILNNTTGKLSESSVIEKSVVPAGRTRLSKYNPHQPTSVSLADINSDGLLDIVFLSEGSGAYCDAQLGYLCQTGSGVGNFKDVAYAPAVNPVEDGEGQAGVIHQNENEGFGDEVVNGGITAEGDVGGMIMADISGDGYQDAIFTVTKDGLSKIFVVLGTGKSTNCFKAPIYANLSGDLMDGLSFGGGTLDAPALSVILPTTGFGNLFVAKGNTIYYLTSIAEKGAEGTITVVLRSANSVMSTNALDTAHIQQQKNTISWLDEWSTYYIEVWGNPGATGAFTSFNLALTYESGYYLYDSIEAGGLGDVRFSVAVDNSTAGTLLISGTSQDLNITDTGKQVLLARVKMTPVENGAISLDDLAQEGVFQGFVNSESVKYTLSAASQSLNHSKGVSTESDSFGSLVIYPVRYDINDDGKIDYTDFYELAEDFGQTPTGKRKIFDIGEKGTIDYNDFYSFSDGFAYSWNSTFTTGRFYDAASQDPTQWWTVSSAKSNALVVIQSPVAQLLSNSLTDEVGVSLLNSELPLSTFDENLLDAVAQNQVTNSVPFDLLAVDTEDERTNSFWNVEEESSSGEPIETSIEIFPMD